MAPKDKIQTTDRNGTPEDEALEVINATVESLRPSQRALLGMLTDLENIATEENASQAFTGDDIAGILMAETEAEMWDADNLPQRNAKVLSGCELRIYGFEVRLSTDTEISTILIGPKGQRKMYLLVHAELLNSAGGLGNIYKLPSIGEAFTFNTSARYIVAKLYREMKFGRFDNDGYVDVRIEGTDLGSGKSIEKLALVGAPTLAGTTEPPF